MVLVPKLTNQNLRRITLKKIAAMFLGLSLIIGGTSMFAQDTTKKPTKTKTKKTTKSKSKTKKTDTTSTDKKS